MLGVHLLDHKTCIHAGSYTTIWASPWALTLMVSVEVFELAYGSLTARLQIICGTVTKVAKRWLGVRDDFVSIESLWARLRIVDGSVADVRHSKIHFYYKSSDGMGDRFATRYLLNVSYVFYDGYCRNRGDFTFNFSSCALREFRTR